MKKLQLLVIALVSFSCIVAQQKEVDFNTPSGLKMETDYSSEIQELSDVFSFEGIDYMKIKFSGEELKGKSYKLSVKEIWDGVIVSDTIVMDSKNLGITGFEKLSEPEFKLRIVSKHTQDNKLKITFNFPRFSVTKQYDAIDSNDYSLRNIADESNLEIKYNEKFYLLAYILPYEREDGSKSWCDVGTSGSDLENWGKKFGIKHYLLFEMQFD